MYSSNDNRLKPDKQFLVGNLNFNNTDKNYIYFNSIDNKMLIDISTENTILSIEEAKYQKISLDNLLKKLEKKKLKLEKIKLKIEKKIKKEKIDKIYNDIYQILVTENNIMNLDSTKITNIKNVISKLNLLKNESLFNHLNGTYFSNINGKGIVIYIHNNNALVIYYNKNYFDNIILCDIRAESDTYYFSNNKKIEFVYNVDVIKNSIRYTKLYNNKISGGDIKKKNHYVTIWNNVSYSYVYIIPTINIVSYEYIYQNCMDKIKTTNLEKNMNNLFKNSDISYYYIINSGCLKYNMFTEFDEFDTYNVYSLESNKFFDIVCYFKNEFYKCIITHKNNKIISEEKLIFNKNLEKKTYIKTNCSTRNNCLKWSKQSVIECIDNDSVIKLGECSKKDIYCNVGENKECYDMKRDSKTYPIDKRSETKCEFLQENYKLSDKTNLSGTGRCPNIQDIYCILPSGKCMDKNSSYDEWNYENRNEDYCLDIYKYKNINVNKKDITGYGECTTKTNEGFWCKDGIDNTKIYDWNSKDYDKIENASLAKEKCLQSNNNILLSDTDKLKVFGYGVKENNMYDDIWCINNETNKCYDKYSEEDEWFKLESLKNNQGIKNCLEKNKTKKKRWPEDITKNITGYGSCKNNKNN